jgi:hypothetical protein
LLGYCGDVLQSLRLAKGSNETATLHPRSPQHAPLGENDGPRNQAEQEEKKKNNLGDWAGFTQQVKNLAADHHRGE